MKGTTNVQRASTVSAGLTFVHVEVEYELRRADEGAEVARAVSDAIAQHIDALRRRYVRRDVIGMKDLPHQAVAGRTKEA